MFGFPFGFSQGGNDQQGHEDDEHNHQEQQQQQINNTQYYQILGVGLDASQQQIKNAYEKLVSQLKPDQSPQDKQKLKLINEAYQTLKDIDKKAIYDEYGKMQQQDDDEESQQNLLNMFFGGGKKKNKNQKLKVQSTKLPLQITLQNIYNGQTRKIQHKRMRNCQKCGGKGGQNVQNCKQCKGQGYIDMMLQVGPGAYQQIQKPCEKCQGQGQIIQQSDKCKQCLGKKIIQKQTTVEVNIQKGVPNNYPIIVQGEGNQIPQAIPGDLIFITQQKQHQIFKRQGADLFMKKNISLLQALTGFQFVFKHLCGTQYTLYTKQSQITSDSDKKIVKGLGLPFHKKPTQFGNLIVQFNVVMPKRGQLQKAQIKQLTSILPGQVNQRPTNDNYLMFEDFDKQNLNTNEEGGRKQEDQYDEDAEQGGTYCATQ